MNFLRRGWYKHKRLGKGKKRKVGWRRPKGRDNKIRESRKGKQPLVSIGYKRKKEKKNKKIIYNLRDLEEAKKHDLLILGRVGNKKKKEIAKKAHEMKVEIQNLNIKKVLKNESG